MPATSLNDYEVIAPIGAGSYGNCKKIRRKKDGKILVWKEMEYGTMSETEKQMLVSEVNLLRELKHKHIVRYYDRIVDRTNSILYLVMEFCDGGDLATMISTLKREGRIVEESFVWKICYQAVLALKECHGRHKNGKAILHRDLKPANIFLDADNNVKLGDFGLARVLNHETSFARTFVGTPYYMSPEQMKYQSYNNKSDIWSLGCLLYELSALRPPFTAGSQNELSNKICNGIFPRLHTRFSDDLYIMIATMLRVDEFKRPSALQLLEHPQIIRRFCNSASDSQAEGKLSGVSSLDEGYESKHNSLRKREDELKAQEKTLHTKEKHLLAKEAEIQQKEQQLESRLRDLEAREKTVHLKELLAEERLSRAERIKDYTQLKLKVNETPCGDTYSESYRAAIGTTIMDPQKSVEDLPKKRVTFTGVCEKENYYRLGNSVQPTKKLLQNKKFDSDIVDLQKRLTDCKILSDAPKKTDSKLKYKPYNVIGLR